jgi:hypothetical protein
MTRAQTTADPDTSGALVSPQRRNFVFLAIVLGMLLAALDQVYHRRRRSSRAVRFAMNRWRKGLTGQRFLPLAGQGTTRSASEQGQARIQQAVNDRVEQGGRRQVSNAGAKCAGVECRDQVADRTHIHTFGAGWP